MKTSKTTNKTLRTSGGMLIAIGENGAFQFIGEASTRDEAIEMRDDYLRYGVECDCLAPETFQIHRRSDRGPYTDIEDLGL